MTVSERLFTDHADDPPHPVVILDPGRPLAAAVDVHGPGGDGRHRLADVLDAEPAGKDQGVGLPEPCGETPVGPLPRSAVTARLPEVRPGRPGHRKRQAPGGLRAFAERRP